MAIATFEDVGNAGPPSAQHVEARAWLLVQGEKGREGRIGLAVFSLVLVRQLTEIYLTCR